jgi:hypothetical protein
MLIVIDPDPPEPPLPTGNEAPTSTDVSPTVAPADTVV